LRLARTLCADARRARGAQTRPLRRRSRGCRLRLATPPRRRFASALSTRNRLQPQTQTSWALIARASPHAALALRPASRRLRVSRRCQLVSGLLLILMPLLRCRSSSPRSLARRWGR
jgi:hypothetical protein